MCLLALPASLALGHFLSETRSINKSYRVIPVLVPDGAYKKKQQTGYMRTCEERGCRTSDRQPAIWPSQRFFCGASLFFWGGGKGGGKPPVRCAVSEESTQSRVKCEKSPADLCILSLILRVGYALNQAKMRGLDECDDASKRPA